MGCWTSVGLMPLDKVIRSATRSISWNRTPRFQVAFAASGLPGDALAHPASGHHAELLPTRRQYEPGGGERLQPTAEASAANALRSALVQLPSTARGDSRKKMSAGRFLSTKSSKYFLIWHSQRRVRVVEISVFFRYFQMPFLLDSACLS